MTRLKSEHTFDATIQMYTPDNDKIDVHITEAFAISENDKILEALIKFDIPADQYNQLINPNEWFRSDVARRKGNPALKGNAPVEIKARISTVQGLLISKSHGVHASDVADALRDADSNSDLLRTENWYALEVKQEISVPPEAGSGTVKEGYRLEW